jgi:hypothetical protein
MAAWHGPRIRAASGDSIASPAIEAKGLYALTRSESPDRIRALIQISDVDIAELSKSREQWQVREIVTYRENVLRAFDSLVAADMPISIPEVAPPRRRPRRVAAQQRGSGRPRKVNEKDAERIRRILRSGDMTLSETARRFCVSIGTVSRIRAEA